MTPAMVERHCLMTPAAEELLRRAFDVLALSMRAYHKVLKIALTIADLANRDHIDTAQIQEALMYRSLDKSRGGRS